MCTIDLPIKSLVLSKSPADDPQTQFDQCRLGSISLASGIDTSKRSEAVSQVRQPLRYGYLQFTIQFQIDDQTGKMAPCTFVRRRDHGHMQNTPIYHGCSRHSSDSS